MDIIYVQSHRVVKYFLQKDGNVYACAKCFPTNNFSFMRLLYDAISYFILSNILPNLIIVKHANGQLAERTLTQN